MTDKPTDSMTDKPWVTIQWGGYYVEIKPPDAASICDEYVERMLIPAFRHLWLQVHPGDWDKALADAQAVLGASEIN